MNTFVQKLGRSLWAMTCGWFACNLVLNIFTLIMARDWRDAGAAVLLFGFYSGLVILVAWLAIFLPVDLLMAEDSRLRHPPVAAAFGFVAGSCVPLALVWFNTGGPRLWDHESLHWVVLPWALSPGITGMVAAWVRSRRGRETQQTPLP